MMIFSQKLVRLDQEYTSISIYEKKIEILFLIQQFSLKITKLHRSNHQNSTTPKNSKKAKRKKKKEEEGEKEKEGEP